MLNLFLIITVTILVYVSIGFFVSIALKRNDIADVMWGPGIFLSVLTAYFISGIDTLPSKILLLVVFLWALRIFLHIGLRFISKTEEDFRYKIWRESWKYFYLRSFFQIYILQGALMILVGSSVILYFNSNLNFNYLFAVGIVLAILALWFEAIADWQLKKFLTLNKLKKDNNLKIETEIMQSGVWKYSRHPNYFGEVSFWWAIFIATLPGFYIISPLTITYLILYVSGIPLLEAKYKDNKEFQIYKSKTPAFFPKFF